MYEDLKNNLSVFFNWKQIKEINEYLVVKDNKLCVKISKCDELSLKFMFYFGFLIFLFGICLFFIPIIFTSYYSKNPKLTEFVSFFILGFCISILGFYVIIFTSKVFIAINIQKQLKE